MDAKIWNHRQWVNSKEPDIIKEEYSILLKSCGFKVLNYIEYKFNPQGFSAMWLLAESHFAVHTFPEEGKMYIEMSSCSMSKYIEFVKKIEYVK